MARLPVIRATDYRTTTNRLGRRRLLAATAVGVVTLSGTLTACGGGGHAAATTTAPAQASSTTSSSTSTTTTVPVKVVTGSETVLSPIGLNVRAEPSRSAPVLGTAAQGTVLTLLGRTNLHGGWLKVRGATVTGWISSDPAYSAPGQFAVYNAVPFSVLYPAGWTTSGVPHTGVRFQAPTPGERVVITTAASVGKLPAVVQGNGVAETGSRPVTGCGVSAYLFSYSTASPDRYFASVALTVAAHHALGIKASLTSLSQLRTVLDFVNSISFPYPVCVGGPPPTTTTVGHKAATHRTHPKRAA
jgi:hypothetical protein